MRSRCRAGPGPVGKAIAYLIFQEMAIYTLRALTAPLVTASGPPVTDYVVLDKTHRSSIKAGLTMKFATDLDGRAVAPKLTSYAVELKTKVLTRGGASYTYFDQARAIRE